ncbi:MAG: YggS family pyridoxal phosphate-dependent enzyme [Pseudoflavonifractor sp.]|nr:YggS family pyridoxal phosphate-dependent enzyme [Alloprevotella sp.]MCM1116680.1 YggS family pyridoxal phosphate-dependent enzyme [Pseudoflavonifractor sp.]
MTARRLEAVRATIPRGVELVAVSKFHPAEAIREAYDAGQRLFGESRAAELTQKAAILPPDIIWHFIGHLQTNKVRPVVATASMIESIDSERLLLAVDAEAARQGRKIDILLELHVAAEATKSGFTPDEAMEIAARVIPTLKATKLRGVMGMASNTPDDPERISADFHLIAETFSRLKAGPMASDPTFTIISMGMSDDRDEAIRQGSTMVRVGTAIFGPREY